jgi:hypothetical protein
MGKPTFDSWNSKALCLGVQTALFKHRDVRDQADEVLDFQLSSEGMKLPNKIGGFKQTQGTETSKYLEERTSTETPLVVASERGPGQWRMQVYRNRLEWRASWVTAPYEVDERSSSSKAGHVQSCLNMGGPPSKPKYSSATDSEQVP